MIPLRWRLAAAKTFASFKCPRRFVVVDKLPRNALGKVQKHLLGGRVKVKILMVASEAAPFVKTGGLADVLGALPPALVRLGEEVGVVLPKYRVAETVVNKEMGAELIWRAMPVWVGPGFYPVDIHRILHRGVNYFFVDCPALYDRPEIYGSPDDNIRFALLSQAALGIARHIYRPGVLHTHDWQAGLIAPYLRSTFATDPTFRGMRTLLTIHNLGYQGNFPAGAFADLGLDPGLYNPGGLEFWNRVSYLKAAIVWSDAINTVSPTYAREIQTPEYGFGMDDLLRSHSQKLSGILTGSTTKNGILKPARFRSRIIPREISQVSTNPRRRSSLRWACRRTPRGR